ncbi:MAG: hypothetical protein GW848_01825 [Rhodoferax sp.]|nr:hypothetical protein [Rhodoferax sp.]OIP23739.1 MAG: hypothetical protein AUK52_04020 [Comamonadaceae bacterium CG2_30_60_41]PIW09039.1 MAG: hypothetical protein COW39_07195 [Comamonadaceae bacterium CG17_big_fil_post_rev_8_21_14_2_50_60_13]PIY26375.1 MAG: hypothetical protein COZ10_02690 [Comamonadaceae bacterium CG_4_10_14_3_um_filter_60_75]PJC11542.1 MAG: hypothetical protein CO066_15045 [Comamonadaceae bacterium CG_4_9_14_0_8_um_filter_60_18]
MVTNAAPGKTVAAKKAPAKAATAVKAVAKKSVAPAVKTAAPKVLAPKPAVTAAKPSKVKKAKLVRDSFTIPKDEYVVIDLLKVRAGKLGQSVKKSELLRAGIKALAALSDIQFKVALSNVPTIKTGRPKDVK